MPVELRIKAKMETSRPRRRPPPELFQHDVETETQTLILRSGEELNDCSWAAWFAKFQTALRDQSIPGPRGPESFQRCTVDFTACKWADPSPLLSIALAIVEYVAAGGSVRVQLPPVPPIDRGPPDKRASFLKFLAREGFLEALSLIAVENLSRAPLPSFSSPVDVVIGDRQLDPTLLNELRHLSAPVAFERATCLPARLLQLEVPETVEDSAPLDQVDRWVERKLFDTIEPVVSDMVPGWAQAGIRYRLLMFLRETLHNIAEHAYIHRSSDSTSTSGFAAVYVRYREGALGEAPANWDRLKPAVDRETYSWRVPLMGPTSLRKPFPNTRTGFFEVFVMDAGQGLCRSLGDCPPTEASDPVHQCMLDIFQDGRGRRAARPTRYGGLYLTRQLLEPSRDYFRIRDENTWWGLELPLKTTSTGSRPAGQFTQSTTGEETTGHILHGLSWTARLSWLEKQDILTEGSAWTGFQLDEDKSIRDSLLDTLRQTRSGDGHSLFPIIDLRFSQFRLIGRNAPVTAPAPCMLILPQPGWMKNHIQDEIETYLKDTELEENGTLILGDIPSEEALTYIAAIERSSKFSRSPFSVIGRVVLITRELKSCVLTRGSGGVLEHDRIESEEFFYNGTVSPKHIAGLTAYFSTLRSHDTHVAWTLILSNADAYTDQCVEWSNNVVLNGYLDFPQSLAHPVCREIYSLSLLRLVSLFPRHNCRLIALDSLVESLLVRFYAQYHFVSIPSGDRPAELCIRIGSVQVSGITESAADAHGGPTFFFFVHPSGGSKGRSLLVWKPGLKVASPPCAYERVGRTPVVAPGGWKSFQLPRFRHGVSVYEQAPKESYRAWQEPGRTPMKLGHWSYGGHHDLLTLNLLLAFDTELDKINLTFAGSVARFVYSNLFVLFGVKQDDLQVRGQELYAAIQKDNYQQQLPDDLDERNALVVYPSHPVTDHIFDRFLGLFKEAPLSRIRQRLLPILPIRRHRTGSGLQVSGMILRKLRELSNPTPPVVFFDDALVTGRTYAELKSLLRSLDIQDIFSLVLVDRQRFPSAHHVDGSRHLCYWRLDIPPMASERDCPLCAARTVAKQMADGLLIREQDKARVSSWCDTWRPLNPATMWGDGGLQPIPVVLRNPLRRFSIEPDPNDPPNYRQCGGKGREIEISNSAGLVCWISELHTITYRDDLCVSVLGKDSIDPQASIQVLASQLLLFFSEFDYPIAEEIALRLMLALWTAHRHDRHTALAVLALIACGEAFLRNILATFLTPERLQDLQTRNIDAILLCVMISVQREDLSDDASASSTIRTLRDAGVVNLARALADRLELYDQFHYIVKDLLGKCHSSELHQFVNAGSDPTILEPAFLKQVSGVARNLALLVEQLKPQWIRLTAEAHSEYDNIKSDMESKANELKTALDMLATNPAQANSFSTTNLASAIKLTKGLLEQADRLHAGLFAAIGLDSVRQDQGARSFPFFALLCELTESEQFKSLPNIFRWHESTLMDVQTSIDSFKRWDVREAYLPWDQPLTDAFRQLLTNKKHAEGDPTPDPWRTSLGSEGTLAHMWGKLDADEMCLRIELRNSTSQHAYYVQDHTRKKRITHVLRNYGTLRYYESEPGTLVTEFLLPYAHTLSSSRGELS